MRTEPIPLSCERFDKLKRLLPSQPRLENGALLTDQATPWTDEPYILTETSVNIMDETT